MDQMLLTPPVR